MENTNAPKLRFPGFTSDWEQRKFGEIAQRQSETMVSDDDNPCVEYEDVISELGTLNKDIFAKGVYKNGIRFTPEDVLYGKLRPYLHNWLNPDFTGVAVGDWWVLRPLDADKNFLFRLLQTSKYDDAANQSSGTKMPRADWKLISNLEFEIPATIEEQEKIAGVFDNLDNLITLHQRKLEYIKTFKGGMLEKMFPQNGSLVPEIRFPGFSDEWKQVNLGNIYSERNERGNDTLQFLSVSIHSGVSDQELDPDELGKTVKRSKDKSTYKHVYKGDLVFNMMRAWQGAIGVAKSEGMISPAYISAIPNHKIFPLFMDYALRRKEIIDQINNLSYGVTDFRKRLYWSSFVNVKCMLPTTEEQEKIWRFFKNCDDLIALYQSKITAMNKYKAGLLQQMLV